MTLLPNVDTPAVLVDFDALEHNLSSMAQRARRAGVKLRPHTKTHKSSWIARRQLAHGAHGIAVAKLGEAEAMADAGLNDILVAYPIVGPLKLERLQRLAERVRLTLSLDDVAIAEGIGSVGRTLGRALPVYVDVDCGMGRCGRPPGKPTAELVLEVLQVEGVEVRGLMTHTSQGYRASSSDEIREAALEEARAVAESARLLARHGVVLRELSVGATPTAHYIGEVKAAFPEITELRPGNYVFNDAKQMALGVATEADCALSVLATVVGRPVADRVVVDAGSKTMGADAGIWPGYGRVRGDPTSVVTALSEEHGTLQVAPDAPYRIGDRLELIPNHSCIAPNLTDEFVVVRGGREERRIRAEGRGRNR